jgi:hypothetical protein
MSEESRAKQIKVKQEKRRGEEEKSTGETAAESE